MDRAKFYNFELEVSYPAKSLPHLIASPKIKVIHVPSKIVFNILWLKIMYSKKIQNSYAVRL